MRFSYNIKNVFLDISLILLMIYTVWILYLLHTSYFATHFPFVYFGLFILLLSIEILAYKTAKPFVKGQRGEMDVHDMLKKLPSSYIALHDVLIGKKGNIDEVVINPSGIWTIEVKNYKEGTITFENGVLCKNHFPMMGDPLKQSNSEALSLQEFIRQSLGIYTPVTPLLVFANNNDKMSFGFKPINGVYVIGIRGLIKFFEEQTPLNRLTPEQCKAIADEIKKYTSIV